MLALRPKLQVVSCLPVTELFTYLPINKLFTAIIKFDTQILFKKLIILTV